jgi:lipoprotein-releasing system permease protein
VFELSIVKKYLIPKRKQLSLSLIALMSVGVISLVVWLVLVFLSVTEGIERNWLVKLTALNAPLRINPTPAYYSSYFYLAYSVSARSEFTLKTIAEKNQTLSSDPYSQDLDEEIPSFWPAPERTQKGELLDPVKKAYDVLAKAKKNFPGLLFQDYEMAIAQMRLQITPPSNGSYGEAKEQSLTQVTYLSSFSEQNPYLKPHLTKPADHKMPSRRQGLQGILVAKSFQESGVRLGDVGTLSYAAATTGSMQEQRQPIYVAGFYDPGILPVGNKCILAPPEVVRTINASSGGFAIDKTLSNGIQVWFPDHADAIKVKAQLSKAFAEVGIDRYWKISTFHEYDFSKDLMQQFQSDKTLFTMIGVIILIVACCNIISLLILLVQSKKKEIAILLSIGAPPKSIALIFGLCGISMGVLSSIIGTLAAILTLSHIDTIASFLSFLQGHDAFNAVFYGNSLPSELSSSALGFILIATPLISLCAGLVPAIKACRIRPSTTLRSE